MSSAVEMSLTVRQPTGWTPVESQSTSGAASSAQSSVGVVVVVVSGSRVVAESAGSLGSSLISAGSETTTLGACHMFRHLFDHPDQFALVREDPSLIPNAVREALRYDFGSLAAVTPRYATEDFELHGKTIRRGDSIMLSPASANRDASVFEDPHRFDVTRDAREALTFGNGPHYCLGANLAMQELSFMLDAALTFLSADAVLESSEDDWEQVGIMRRPLRMIVDLQR